MTLDSALKKVVPDISQPKKSRPFLMHWMSVKLPDNFQIREHSWPCLFHIKKGIIWNVFGHFTSSLKSYFFLSWPCYLTDAFGMVCIEFTVISLNHCTNITALLEEVCGHFLVDYIVWQPTSTVSSFFIQGDNVRVFFYRKLYNGGNFSTIRQNNSFLYYFNNEPVW